MKLFIDSADTQEIFDCVKTGFISGVTTNPTLIKKSGREPDQVYSEILTMGIDDLSMEVVGTKSEMFLEADRLLDKFGNTKSTIKVPCTPDGLEVCRELTKDNVKVNVTLIFSAAQSAGHAHLHYQYGVPQPARHDYQLYQADIY